MVEQASHNGQRIGNYRLIKLLGRGGFAEVYLAEHIHLNTQAAVKLLSTQLANEDITLFRNEARMIAGLLHPHIVRVLDFGVENSVPYLVMDYAPNGTLRLLHPKGSRLPLQLVISYVQQIASALQYAHEQRVIHRDIKPENMLIGRNQEILLTDFGIALVAQSSHYQKAQDIAGTLAYMAPEQIQAHPRPASDQYSLGIVVYEWLGGQRPFQGTMTEIAIKHATATPPSLRLYAPEVPVAIEQVVLKALQKNPHDRFPTIIAFAQALEQASNQLSQPFTGGINLASSNIPPTNQSQIPLQYQLQAPTPTSSTQGYANLPSNPQVSPTGAQPLPLPYPGYPMNPAYQVPSSPAQNGGSLPPASV
ncbi:MAG: serine/threonine protein kinase [Ktedonobacteraceae bacterium]